MINVSEFLIFLAAASLPITYVLIMRHFIAKNEAEDLASLPRTGPLDPHECCCEQAAKALAGGTKTEASMVATH